MSRSNDPEIPVEALERQHEQRDLRIGVLMAGLAGLALLTVAAIWLMAVLFNDLERRTAARQPAISPLIQTDVKPPQPRLETAPGQILSRLRALEEVQLTSYGWVDRKTRIAHLPIERAMRIVAQRGLPHAAAPPEEEAR